MPTVTDARGGRGGFGHGGGMSGHAHFGGGFGHGGGMMSGHAHFGGASTVRNAGPPIPGPATVSLFSFSGHSSAFSRSSFSGHAGSHRHSHAIGSHFFTLGADGVWLDNFVYAPTIVVASPPVIEHKPAQSRHLVTVKTPSADESGIILVRGDNTSYVVFPSRDRG